MIGLFDSGYGGLTILHGILDELPEYSCLYLGDNARAPYGSRSSEEIFEFTKQGVDYLFSHGCALVILACNTASASALRKIQQEVLPAQYPDKKVLGILVPTIEQITGVPWKQTSHSMSALGVASVGVLATEATVKSNSYADEIHKRNPSIRVFQQACPGLVEAIEAGEDVYVITTMVSGYVAQLKKQVPPNAAPISAILLGCTHYALIADLITKLLPPEVRLYEQPRIVATSLKKYLAAHPEIEQKLDRKKERIFVTTGNSNDVSAQSQKYFGQSIQFKSAALAD